MALTVKDRVRVVTTTTGTSDFTLGGAVAGYQSFSVIGDGNTTYYACSDSVTGDWEVGVGTYSSSGPTLSRDTVLESSNSGSKVSFAAGSKDVFVTYPAERAVYLDTAGSAVTTLDVGTLGVSTANITTANITSGTVSNTPSSGTDIANKTYVDTIASSGVTYHTPVKYEAPNALTATYNNGTSGVGATLTNSGTLGAFTPDGVVASVNDRILIYQQASAAHNGVYTVTTVGNGSTAWVLTRSTDTDSYALKDPNGLGEGDAFFVTSGNTGAGETYICNTQGTITFGTTAINFVQVSSAQIYSAGTGLTLSGTQFSITDTGTAGTYGSASSVPVLTTNAQGQVTSVTNTAISITSAAVSGLAASATTDTTNAANITSGTLPSARLIGSYANITGVGTLTSGTWNASTIGATYGGTGQSSYTTGDLLYASSSSALSTLADVATGNALISGGVGTAPSWGKVGLTTHVSGTLPVASGGTGATTLTGYVYGNGTGAMTASTSIPNAATTATSANTASAIVARDASGNFSAGTITASLSGNATSATSATSATTATNLAGGVAGAVPYQSGSGATAFSAAGTSGQVLTSAGTSAPTWTTPATVNNGTLTMAVSGTGLSGSASFTANQSGASSFTVTSNATNANTASTIVARDASGNFSAGTITATGFSGPLNGTVGATTPSTGAFTTLSSTGNTTLGDASTDTVTVNGYVGVGVAPDSRYKLQIGGTTTNGVSSYGALIVAAGDSSATTRITGVGSQPTTSASAYTSTDVEAFRALTIGKGAGSTITNAHGLKIEDQTQGTNNYGITSLVSSGANKYNIYASGTAENYFAGNVGIGAVAGSTTGQLRIAGNGSGATTFNGITLETSIQSGVTSAWRGLLVRPTTQATAFTLANLYGVYVNPQTFGAGSTVTNQYGFHAESTLTGATNNYGFYSNIASGTGRWNFYANGTADNYFAGNVGIGVTPTTKLDVSGTSRYTFNVSNAYTLQTSLNAAGSAFADDYKNALSHIWQTSGTERMRIDSSGNVGIGTSSPSVKLEVNRGSAGSIATFTDGVSTNFNFSTSGTVGTFGTDAGSTSLALKTSGTERLRIDSSGNVGIGTTSPSSKLEVYDATSAVARVTAGTEIFEIRNTGSEVRLAVVSADPMTFRTSNVEAMRIDSSGNVGIGTTSPSTYGKFAVQTQTSNAPTVAITGSGLSPQLNHYINDSTAVLRNLNQIQFVTGSSDISNYQGYMTFSTMGSAGGTISERMRINSSGYVGIANASPACALDVTGGIKTSRTTVTSPAATDGNVFSGTYTPTLTNTTNITSSTAYTCQYMRVGNVVTVSGKVDLTPTTAPSGGARATLGISLPIASAMTNSGQLGGTGVVSNAGATNISGGPIFADTTNDIASFDFRTSISGSSTYFFTFTYQIL